MTLDEAIEHARDKAKEQKYYASFERGKRIQSCKKCAEEHEQLAEWLEELKEYKENKHRSLRYMFEKGYNKGIDDLTEKISIYGTYDYYGNVVHVLEIAEKLKEHKTLNIVHCKDCKHWGTGVAGETENIKCCEYGKYMVGENGYCVYGEKECAE